MAFMDLPLAIDRNRDRLLRIIAELFVMAGIAEGGMAAALPRHVPRAVLRPAESDLRRLVIIAARGRPSKRGSPGRGWMSRS
jgi:hypothetical protein